MVGRAYYISRAFASSPQRGFGLTRRWIGDRLR
jgi:hypothetical protein